ncbi:MAG: NUDIX domain-containing protein [Lachnospiraceae bacterium]|nr:NUDIX domain-containing protein [Lachnospiraceae bacterium]
MKFIDIEKKESGRYINRYDVSYETEDGEKKVYEMISRDPNITDFDKLHGKVPADAVVLIIHNLAGDKILLNREFRLAPGKWVYNFPAGLIDPGEMPEEAAERELREETGLHLDSICDLIPASYSAVGFSNEKNVCIVGTASGEFAKSSSSVEEIEAGWYSRKEVKELLKKELFAARTQAYCYLWCRAGKEHPHCPQTSFENEDKRTVPVSSFPDFS